MHRPILPRRCPSARCSAELVAPPAPAIGFQRRDLLPRRQVIVAGSAAEEARFNTMIASAQAEAAAEAKVRKAEEAKADAKVKEFLAVFPPPYNLIGASFYAGAKVAASWINKALGMGDDYNGQKYQDRARDLMLRFMKYGRPAPAPIGFDVETWSSYGDTLEQTLAVFDSLPEDQRAAMIWLGEKIEAYGGNAGVLDIVAAGGEWYFTNLPAGVPDAGGAYPYCAARPWEPMLAGTVAGLAAVGGNPSDEQKQAVLRATVKAWSDFPVPPVTFWEGKVKMKVTQPDGSMERQAKLCLRADGKTDTPIHAVRAGDADQRNALERWAATAVAAKKASEEAGQMRLRFVPLALQSTPMSAPAKVAVGAGVGLGLFALAKWVLIPLLA